MFNFTLLHYFSFLLFNQSSTQTPHFWDTNLRCPRTCHPLLRFGCPSMINTSSYRFCNVSSVLRCIFLSVIHNYMWKNDCFHEQVRRLEIERDVVTCQRSQAPKWQTGWLEHTPSHSSPTALLHQPLSGSRALIRLIIGNTFLYDFICHLSKHRFRMQTWAGYSLFSFVLPYLHSFFFFF